VSATFRRSVEKLGVQAGSPTYRAVSATMRALASADLPGVGDYETAFAPAHAYVRRVTGQNLWLLYRFDDAHVFIMTARGDPPVPFDE
jgi:hypothetical protein